MNNLLNIIRAKLKYDCKGRENSIRRKDLLKYCQGFFPFDDKKITDREMRKLYCLLPVVTCEKGIFWPIRSEELEVFRLYLRAKALPMLKRWRTVANSHPDLISDDYSQMDLF